MSLNGIRPLGDRLTSLEICAGAGGQALGLEHAGFEHVAVVELDADACDTLRLNRPQWNVIEQDVHEFDGTPFKNRVDLFAGGVPCPPFSVAGKQLGADDERDLFPQALRLIREIKPRAVLLENVRGLASARFTAYRETVVRVLEDELGYVTSWQLINSSEHGVPQLRPRFILVALEESAFPHFEWPHPVATVRTVGETLRPFLAASGWKGASAWAKRANAIGPTVVGGSKKHGGPDLGPTRARQAWLELGVDGRGIADSAPDHDAPLDLVPRLTTEMAAALQGFPSDWKFVGRKTTRYRQIGNAFPPPVACAVATSLGSAIRAAAREGRATALRAV